MTKGHRSRVRAITFGNLRSGFFLRFCSIAVLCVVKTRVMRLRVIEGPKARDQIAFCAFHSSLVEVNLVPRVFWLFGQKVRRLWVRD